MNDPQVQPLPRITLLGVALNAVTSAQACDHIDAALTAGRGGWVITPNLDILRRLVLDTPFADLCAGADLRLADGMPLIWASRLRGTPLPERVAGSEFIYPLCGRAALTGRRVFLLGGSPGAAEKAAERLVARFPGLRIAGTRCPPLGFEHDPAEMQGIRQALSASRADVVFVGLGSPKQERLITSLRSEFPGAWFLAVGMTLSFVAGDVKRAPVWMRRVGLEWAHRLAQEPRRLAQRYLLHGPPFAARLLAVSAWEGLRSKRPDHTGRAPTGRG